jgi:ArsR family transcriptional regulator
MLKCLGDQTRVRILKVIIEAKSDLCVCEIVDSLQVPYYTVSKHIKVLKNAEILNETKEGTFVLYSLNEKKDNFQLKIIELINSIPVEYFSSDLKLLSNRLLLRENRNRVVGMNKDNN